MMLKEHFPLGLSVEFFNKKQKLKQKKKIKTEIIQQLNKVEQTWNIAY